MDLIITFLIGLVVGIIAKLIMPGKDPGGFIITALLGVAGAFIARMIGQAAGWYNEGEPAGFIAAVGGALVLLLLYRMLVGRGSRTGAKT